MSLLQRDPMNTIESLSTRSKHLGGVVTLAVLLGWLLLGESDEPPISTLITYPPQPIDTAP